MPKRSLFVDSSALGWPLGKIKYLSEDICWSSGLRKYTKAEKYSWKYVVYMKADFEDSWCGFIDIMSNESLWSDQSSEQDSTPGPILETTLLGGADDHVIVKLLTTNTTTSNGSEVLTKLLTGSSSPAAINVGTTILLTSNVQSQGLRKIEPKPSDSGEVIEKVEADNDSNPYGRWVVGMLHNLTFWSHVWYLKTNLKCCLCVLNVGLILI